MCKIMSGSEDATRYIFLVQQDGSKPLVACRKPVFLQYPRLRSKMRSFFTNNHLCFIGSCSSLISSDHQEIPPLAVAENDQMVSYMSSWNSLVNYPELLLSYNSEVLFLDHACLFSFLLDRFAFPSGVCKTQISLFLLGLTGYIQICFNPNWWKRKKVIETSTWGK